jgi:hypothetical protein
METKLQEQKLLLVDLKTQATVSLKHQSTFNGLYHAIFQEI